MNMCSLPAKMLNIRICRLIAVVSVASFGVLLLIYLRTGSFAAQTFVVSHNKELYGIMLDAGSTGSRIHVFHFHELPGGHVKLISEYFEETKPGLSSYETDPKKGADSINKLLQKAKGNFPVDKLKETPVALKATAGLRLLPENASVQLLKEVCQVFISSPFAFSRPEDVSIMDGRDEGIFAWVTVNFLTGAFDREQTSLVGIMDLGGGSTQIAFNPLNKETEDQSPDGFLDSISIFDHKHKLYCHSYLGLGLMSARAAILAQGKPGSVSPAEQNLRHSPCFPPQFKENWKFNGETLEISGDSNYGFDSCFEQASKVVSDVHKPDEVNTRKFYFFSYYYDRAVDLGLADESKGGVITLGDFISGAKRECSRGSSPFLCLDTVYISALLQKGFGFKDSIELTLRRKINDVEISWALGATLDLFDKRRSS